MHGLSSREPTHPEALTITALDLETALRAVWYADKFSMSAWSERVLAKRHQNAISRLTGRANWESASSAGSEHLYRECLKGRKFEAVPPFPNFL